MVLLFVNLYILLSLELTAAVWFFPTNSTYGIFAAIAVPLGLPNRDVFVSYNFEANYNLPSHWDIPPIAAGFEDEDRSINGQCTNCPINENSLSATKTINEDNDTTETTNGFTTNSTDSTTSQSGTKNIKKSQQQSLLSRFHFYYILMDKFQRSGYEGEACLLRLICEMNSSDLGYINGILGNLIHIIFSPSTSMYEELPLAFYQAEIDGEHDQCEKYNKNCKKNLLDLISSPLNDIVNKL